MRAALLCGRSARIMTGLGAEVARGVAGWRGVVMGDEAAVTDERPRALAMTTLMTPGMVNFGGKVHGGALLKLLDEVAYSCAARFSGEYVVTLLIDEARFRAPVHVGELVTFLAHVNWVGRTSMEVGIRVMAEDHRTRVARHVMSCFVVMVAMDESGAAIAVPRFEPADEDERRRWADAERRRASRMALSAP